MITCDIDKMVTFNIEGVYEMITLDIEGVFEINTSNIEESMR